MGRKGALILVFSMLSLSLVSTASAITLETGAVLKSDSWAGSYIVNNTVSPENLTVNSTHIVLGDLPSLSNRVSKLDSSGQVSETFCSGNDNFPQSCTLSSTSTNDNIYFGSVIPESGNPNPIGGGGGTNPPPKDNTINLPVIGNVTLPDFPKLNFTEAQRNVDETIEDAVDYIDTYKIPLAILVVGSILLVGYLLFRRPSN